MRQFTSLTVLKEDLKKALKSLERIDKLQTYSATKKEIDSYIGFEPFEGSICKMIVTYAGNTFKVYFKAISMPVNKFIIKRSDLDKLIKSDDELKNGIIQILIFEDTDNWEAEKFIPDSKYTTGAYTKVSSNLTDYFFIDNKTKISGKEITLNLSDFSSALKRVLDFGGPKKQTSQRNILLNFIGDKLEIAVTDGVIMRETTIGLNSNYTGKISFLVEFAHLITNFNNGVVTINDGEDYISIVSEHFHFIIEKKIFNYNYKSILAPEDRKICMVKIDKKIFLKEIKNITGGKTNNNMMLDVKLYDGYIEFTIFDKLFDDYRYGFTITPNWMNMDIKGFETSLPSFLRLLETIESKEFSISIDGSKSGNIFYVTDYSKPSDVIIFTGKFV